MENIKIFTQLISSELHLQEHAVENTLKLLDEGCTIPFISRYRKERTGGLDEVQITSISNRLSQLQEIAKRKETIVVPDVEQFPGHIACSSLSRSEIVVPVFSQAGEVVAVLDIDSKELATFDETDRYYLETICRLIR